MIMKIPVIIRFDPMVYSHRISKQNESPSDQVWIIWIAKLFSPSYLKILEFLCIAWSNHLVAYLKWKPQCWHANTSPCSSTALFRKNSVSLWHFGHLIFIFLFVYYVNGGGLEPRICLQPYPCFQSSACSEFVRLQPFLADALPIKLTIAIQKSLFGR